jgi:hypothetical protein
MATRQHQRSGRGARAGRSLSGKHPGAALAGARLPSDLIDDMGSSQRQALEGLSTTGQAGAILRVGAVLHHAHVAGYLPGRKSERIGGRVSPGLLSAAMDKSGLRSQAELLEYALAKVALEDDYGAKLLSMKGSVADDVDL